MLNAQTHSLPLERWAELALEASRRLEGFSLEGLDGSQSLADLLAAMVADIWRAHLALDAPRQHAAGNGI